MPTRTKILVGVGLLVLAVGAVMVCRPAKPALEVSFVRYGENGAVLAFTNKGTRPVSWDLSSTGVVIETYQGDSALSLSDLSPGDGNQLVARSLAPLPATLSFNCVTLPSPQRQRLWYVLIKAGIDIIGTGYVTTVTLPPEKTNAPAQPVTP